MKNFKVKIINKIDEDFIKSWSTLLDHSKNAHFFNSPQWFISCLDAYDIKEYFIFAAYRGSELVGVLPLIKSKKFFIDVFASPGERYLEKSTVLVKNESSYILDKIISEVLKNGNIYLAEVPEEIAAKIAKRRSNGILTLLSINPYIRLKDSPFGRLSEKQKKRIIGKIKNNFDNFKFGHFRNNLDTHLQSVFELEKRSSKILAGKDSFADLKIRKLFTCLIDYARENIVIDFVYYKNLPIVSSFGFVFKNRYLAYHTAYDNKFRGFIPGKLITFNMLIKLREEGVSLFDFSRGHNAFKNDFSKDFVFQYDFYYSKNILIRIWWEVINFARRLKAHLYKTSSSLDGYYLFKKFANRLFESQESIRFAAKLI